MLGLAQDCAANNRSPLPAATVPRREQSTPAAAAASALRPGVPVAEGLRTRRSLVAMSDEFE
jgi:hypothetical protein